MADNNWNGNGFDKSTIEGEEAARHRQMFHELEESYKKFTDKQVKAIEDLSVMTNGVSIAIKYAAVFGAFGIGFGMLSNFELLLDLVRGGK